MKSALVAAIILLLITGCFQGYAPLEDHSEFVSAQLADDRRTALFTFHRFAYRRATGWRAFPDGGIPKYVTDVNLLGAYDLPTQKVKILRREKNSKWQPGNGLYSIYSSKGTKALIAQGGQIRDSYSSEVRYLLVDFKQGKCSELDLKSDLAYRGRDPGEIYLGDADGTLVFITRPLEGATGSGAAPAEERLREIWIRTPAGAYQKVANSTHYQCIRDGEVIYWQLSTREFFAYSILGGQTRKMPEFKVPGYQDISEGVIPSSDKKGLQAGVKVDGQWKYQPVPLRSEVLK